jgi:hypothetical protein
MKALKFYSSWYPKTWMPPSTNFNVKYLSSENQAHLKFVAKTCKKLARSLFHTMGKYQAKLEYEQLILANFVDIGTDLFVMAASLAYAEQLMKKSKEAGTPDTTPDELANLFCLNARQRIAANFNAVKHNHNKVFGKIARNLMDRKYAWLATDVYDDVPPKYRDYPKNTPAMPEIEAPKEAAVK